SAGREDVPREVAARRADACFRGSLPGDGSRGRVLAKLAPLLDEGLDVAAFDEPDTPSEFFTAPPQRPQPDSVQVRIELGGGMGPGSETVDQRLQSDSVVASVVACFLEDWERHRRRSVEASLPLRVSSRLRDMGSYDVYEGRVTVDASGLPERSFARCAARAVEAAFAESFRLPRTVSWEATATVAASAR
ncbi:MAG: hypothetical protein H5U40_13220, partial [Polyangiaceae bacterium]|nr:hypothetical protein [Polyangiaceae bacterium]